MIRRVATVMLVLLMLVPLAAWGAAALWFRLPLPDPARAAVAGLWLAALVISVVLARRHAVPAALLGLAALGALLVWWSSLAPSNHRDWKPDVSRETTARIDGDVLTVSNVRNFRWRTDTDFDAHWATRQYRLSRLKGADLFLSYWAGENIAHAIVSFDFGDAHPLAWSIEVRRKRGDNYSTVKGFFKMYEMAVIAADERDVVKVRATERHEDVRLFRLDIRQATALGLLRQYVALANDVAAHPRWYNTLTENCTTAIFGMARRLDPTVSLDWRIVLPGQLPSYLREHEFVTRAVPLTELVARSHIGARAAGAEPDDGFSDRIREGVPVP